MTSGTDAPRASATTPIIGGAATASAATPRWVNPRLRRWAPPFREPRFWLVQALVLLIAAGHALIESSQQIDFGGATFVPVSVFLLPVIYAGLAFGLRGSGPTAIWCAVITVPNVLLWHADAADVFGEIWQAGLVVVVGAFVGLRIDRERAARAEVERRERERRASEDKYRTVFESAGDAIILVDEDGLIHEANSAAARLLRRRAAELRDQPISSIAPPDLVAALSDRGAEAVVGPLAGPDGERRWLMPVRTSHVDASGRPLILWLLRDVTLHVERQQLLEDYSGRTLAAREEERRRVARDLHDGPLQSVVLLWRQLDALGVGNPDLRDQLALSRSTAEAIAAELRRFGRDLRPSLLDDLGLRAALRAEVAALEARTGIQGRYDTRGNTETMGEAEQLAFFRICQEALHNVERHAHASKVTVRLAVSSTRAQLVVEDDGIGMAQPPEPAELVGQGRLGLVGMQERARLIGATCTVEASRKKGTLIRLVKRPGAETHNARPATSASSSQGAGPAGDGGPR